MPTSKVLLFGAHPSEGSVSMNLYHEQFISVLPSEINISTWPKVGSYDSYSQSRSRRFLGKYIFYPVRVYLKSRGRGVKGVHFLDHSSGHLIPFVKKGVEVYVTLHDLIPLRDTKGLSNSQYARFKNAVMYMKNASKIFSVSAYSKNEAEELLGIPAEKIVVNPNGVDTLKPLSLVDEVEKMRVKGYDYIILSVGSTAERKNLKVIPEIIREFKGQNDLSIGLLRIGSLLPKGLAKRIRDVVGEDGFTELGRVERQTIWNGYHACDIVIVPSFYEGFGLPVIEALSAGKPVLCSNQSSLPEVGKEMVEYFSPEDSTEGAKALKKIITQLESQKFNGEGAKEYGLSFSWDKHVKACLENYNHKQC